MKKILAIISAICLTLGMIPCANASNPNGLIMSADTFATYYTKDVPTAISTQNNPEIASATVNLSDIAYDDASHQVSFSATIRENNDATTLAISGELLNSYKQEKGINSIVGVLHTATPNAEVLHFEIYNSSEQDLLYMRDEYRNKPHLKLYMRINGQLYFFETDIPNELRNIVIEQAGEDKSRNMLYDGFWFANIIEADVGVSDSSPMRTVEHSTPKTIYYKYTITGAEYTQYCVVNASWTVTDVNRNNPGLWTAGLVIRDVYCVLPSGEIVDGGGVIIQNMDIHFVAGNQTKFLRSMSAFDMYDRNGTILPIGASIAGLTAAVAGFYSVAAVTNTATLLSALMSLPVTETTFFKTNGNSVTTHVTEVCRALRFSYPSRYYLFNEGHKIEHICEAMATLQGSSNATSGNRKGRVEIVFDALYGTTVVDHVTFGNTDCSYYCDLS